MPITVGAAVIIAILGVCGAAALYFAVKSYFWMRRDRYGGLGDDDRRTDSRSEAPKDRKEPPEPR